MVSPQNEPKEQSKERTPGLHAQDTMAEAGRKIMQFHFEKMVQHEPGTRIGEDISELHKMRVATRRMRVGSTIFNPCFEENSIRPIKKGLRSTARALGRVRDLDVFLDDFSIFLQGFSEKETPNDAMIILGWKRERERARSKMLRYFEKGKYQQLLEEFRRFLRIPELTVQSSLVREVVPQIINEQVTEIQAHDQILDNATIEELHALRIEFKKLRYAVEFFQDVLGPESQTVIKDIIVQQDHLGNLNDADVACARLIKSLSRWEKLQALQPIDERTTPYLVSKYLAARKNERQTLVDTYPQTWQSFMREEFSENLAVALSVL
jgi:CHAD domain-containing protein